MEGSRRRAAASCGPQSSEATASADRNLDQPKQRVRRTARETAPLTTTDSSLRRGLTGPEPTRFRPIEGELGMFRCVLKFARQASLVDQVTRPWLAVQGRGW